MMVSLIAATDRSDLMGLLFPIIVIALSLSIPIVAIITEHLQKQQRMRLIEKAIEHGADPSTLNIEVDEKPERRLPYRAGMICLAIGAALVLAPRWVDFNIAGISFPFVLGGYVTGAVGIALLLNDIINRDRFDDPA